MSLDDLPEMTFASSLDRWLWQRRVTARWLADRIGVHEATVSRIRNGQRPSDDLEAAIKSVTGLKRL